MKSERTSEANEDASGNCAAGARLEQEKLRLAGMFEQEISSLLEASGPKSVTPDETASILSGLIALEGPSSPAVRALLGTSGLRNAWNHTFRAERSHMLASWIAPFVRGRVVDLFAGDLSVTRELAVLSRAPVLGVERRKIAPNPETHGLVEFQEVNQLEELAALEGETALLITALHHEPDPMGVLHRLSLASFSRWIVVENCIEQECDRTFQEAADVFFNFCLNESPLYCGPSHRTAAEWREALAGFGSIVLEERRPRAPGVFLPHSLFVVDIDEPLS